MNTLQRDNASRFLPLVKAIGAEIRDRATAIAFLEERLEAFQSTRSRHSDDVCNLQAELAIHRRELRRCRKELESHGFSVDETNPLCIKHEQDGEQVFCLDDTRFWSKADIPT